MTQPHFRKEYLLWFFLTAAVSMGIVWQCIPLSNAQDRLMNLPLRGTAFEGRVIPLTRVEELFFEKTSVIKRVYDIDEQKIIVFAVDGSKNRHAVHDPLYCLRGSGWSVIDIHEVDLGKGSANLVTIEKDGMTKKLLYWFSDGKEIYASPFEYWMRSTWRRLTLGRLGEESVLVVVQPIAWAPLDWKKLAYDFPELLLL